ncbi:RHOMBOID-like protein 12, mitochondrial [Castilleja foliolosa]|uniref:RHOMBOID-like protein 12, mitochondrial n=1 Tax=Castilleja foliolosa TaxID=1961234 RepID=A0ABD3BKP3_9LAMI
MQRQFWVKTLSKIRRNVSCNTNLISPSSVFSSVFLKTNGNPVYQQSFSQNSTLSHSQIWRLCSSSGVRNGVSSSTVLVRSFFSKTLLKGQNKFPINSAIRNFSRRYFHSFDSQHHRGWRSFFRRLTADEVVIGLVVANAAVFILWRVADTQFMINNFMISVDNFTSGRIHTLITSAFSHRDMWHLISNMVGLYFFGLSIGRNFGPEYLLKLYLSGAVVGSIFYLAYHAFIAPSFQSKQMFGIDPSKIPGLGASGAVNAILLLDIFLFPTKTLYLDFIIPVPAILLGIFIIGKDALRILEGDNEVSGSAHLGGATVAALAWAWNRRGRYRRF